MLKLQNASLFHQQAFIDGAWRDADTGAALEVTNPATGERLGRVPAMGRNETRRAIQAAERAWPDWRARTATERGRAAAAVVWAHHGAPR